MGKGSRLRSGQRGKRKLMVFLVLAGFSLFLGHRYFGTVEGGGTGRSLVPDGYEVESSLLDDRGPIFDRNYKELAVTLDRVSIYANVRDINPEEVVDKLSPVLDMQPESLKKEITGESYRAWLAKNITAEEEEAVAELNIKGISLFKERIRYYPEKETAAHILGFVGKSIGLAGVELRYNTLLHKYGGSRRISRAQIPGDGEDLQEEGQYLVLTLDLKIQRILEKFVKNQGEFFPGTKIAALLMECKTGKIIGSAGYPSYDPNRFHDYDWPDLENVLAQQTTIPERIRKLLWDASLIQAAFEKYKEILPWSVYSPERNLGSQLRLWDRLALNDPLRLDFITDDKAHAGTQNAKIELMKSNSYDSVIETGTPLHILAAVNDLVLGGRHITPYVIEKIVAEDGSEYDLTPEQEEITVDEKVAEEIRFLLQDQLSDGPLSSGFLETEDIYYENVDEGRKYSNTQMVFSFIPEEKPRLVLFVFANLPVFSPSPAKTKSRFDVLEPAKSIVVPMVALQEVMSNLADMMSVEEKEKMNFELHQDIKQTVLVNEIEKQVIYGEMPDLRGLSLRKSLRMLKDLKLEIQINGTGVVVEQRPVPGTRIKQGELCRLVLKPH